VKTQKKTQDNNTFLLGSNPHTHTHTQLKLYIHLRYHFPTPPFRRYAANEGNVWACRTLLEHSANPNARDHNGHSPLHHGAFQGSRGNVTAMLQFGGERRLRGDDGVPPYVFALLGEHEIVAEILYFEDTAMVAAVRAGDMDRLKVLLKDGGDPMEGGGDGWTCAHEIASGSNWDALDAIEASLGADAIQWDSPTAYAQTPLMLATANRHGEMAEYIVERTAKSGAASARLNDANRGPMHFACKVNDQATALMLADAGYPVSHPDSYGKTPEAYASKHTEFDWAAVVANVKTYPIHEAMKRRDLDAVRAAIQDAGSAKDADGSLPVSARDGDGLTPLHWAAYTDFPEGARAAILAGAEVNKTYHTGYTSLHLACASQSIATGIVLVESRADCNADNGSRDGGPTTPLSLLLASPVEGRDDTPLVKALLSAGADPRGPADRGTLDLPLHHAARQGRRANIQLLLDAGCNPDDKHVANGADQLPYDVALDGRHPKVAPMLAPAGDLHHAAANGDNDTVSSLLSSGGDPVGMRGGRTPMHLATRGGHRSTLALLVAKCRNAADVDTRETDVAGGAGSGSGGAGRMSASRVSARTTQSSQSMRSSGGAAGSETGGTGAGAGVSSTSSSSTSSSSSGRKTPAGTDGSVAAKLLEQAAQERRDAAAIQYAELRRRGDKPAPNTAPWNAVVDDNDGGTCLHMACAVGDKGMCEDLLAAGASPFSRDAFGRLPAHRAAASGHADCLLMQLERDVAVSSEDAAGNTVVHAAGQGGSVPVVDLVLDAPGGASLRRRANRAGYLPWEIAQSLFNEEAAKLLSVPSGTPLLDAWRASGNDTVSRPARLAQLRTQLRKGALPDEQDENGDTILIAAASDGDVAAIDALLGAMASPDFSDAQGRGPLHHAALNGNAAAAERLLAVDPKTQKPISDVGAKDSHDDSPLHLAAQNGDPDTVSLLLAKSTDPEARKGDRNKVGETPRDRAVRFNNVEAARLLSPRGIAPNELIDACRAGDEVRANAFLDAGADVTEVEEGSGITVIAAAAAGGVPRLIMRILAMLDDAKLEAFDAPGGPRAPDNSGRCAMHHACARGNAKAASLLAKHPSALAMLPPPLSSADKDALERKRAEALRRSKTRGSKVDLKDADKDLAVEGPAAVHVFLCPDFEGDVPAHLAGNAGSPPTARAALQHPTDAMQIKLARNKRQQRPTDAATNKETALVLDPANDPSAPTARIITLVKALDVPGVRSCGPPLDPVDPATGCPPLVLATATENLGLVTALIARGSDPNLAAASSAPAGGTGGAGSKGTPDFFFCFVFFF
jgi:ankyrin repeat protein